MTGRRWMIAAGGVMVLQVFQAILWLPRVPVGPVADAWQGTLCSTVALVVTSPSARSSFDEPDGLSSRMSYCIAAAAILHMYAYRIWFGCGLEAAAPYTLIRRRPRVGMCLGFLLAPTRADLRGRLGLGAVGLGGQRAWLPSPARWMKTR